MRAVKGAKVKRRERRAPMPTSWGCHGTNKRGSYQTVGRTEADLLVKCEGAGRFTARALPGLISGFFQTEDLEACAPIEPTREQTSGSCSVATKRQGYGTSVTSTLGFLINRTDSTVTAPLPTNARASYVPFWTVPVESIIACTETV